MNYLWIKAMHLVSIVSWFAGLFYIFRLLVYHVHHRQEPKIATAYTVMEQKLLHVIMIPALFATFISGGLLITLNPSILRAGWFHAKLGGVFFLIAYQILAEMTHRHFSRNNYWLTERACRILNEVPTLCLILIVILAVVKP